MQTQYFSHDYHARHHPKLLALQQRHGMAGLGAFWCIIEQLYEQGGTLPLEGLTLRLSWELRVSEELIAELLQDFGLFENSCDGITCPAVSERLQLRQEKSEKAQKKAEKRWGNATAMPQHSSSNAAAMQQQCQSNAIKEKVKEKEKEKVKEKIKTIPPLNTTYAAEAAKSEKPAETFEPKGMDKALLERDDVAAAWQAFLAHRRRIKAPVTPYALNLILKKLGELRPNDGAGWAELLNASVERGWRSVFEIDPKLKTPTHDHRPKQKPTLAERYNDTARSLLSGL